LTLLLGFLRKRIILAAAFLALAMCCFSAAQARANDLALGRSARTASAVEVDLHVKLSDCVVAVIDHFQISING